MPDCRPRTRTWRACLSVRARVAVIMLLFIASSSPVSTQTAKVKVVGLGATSCSRFMRDVEQKPVVQRDYLAWAQGFMSGVVMRSPPGVDEGIDLNPASFPLLKQLDFLWDHCVKNSADGFVDAVDALYKRLRQEGKT